jgi:uncharacterized protein YndB with AHSA1/START domain/uncharacterized damage-inducible protein DinB
MATPTQAPPTVKRSVTVRANPERAFDVFTAGFDTWWPRSHHIGKQPLQRAVIEPHVGGRCYGREADGNECQWGTVTAWEPPTRLMIAWQIDPSWQFDPDLSHASEVEVVFTPEANGMTRVDLEHRHFERHGKDFERVRSGVGGEGGWGGLLRIFGRTANVYEPSVRQAAFILSLNDAVADRCFQGVKPEQRWTQPTPRNNSMLWIYAHMAVVRGRLLKTVGGECAVGWEEAFGRGAQLQDPSTYPSYEQILEGSHEINARLFARLAALTEADLSRPSRGPVPPAVQTIADLIAFTALHDAYHVGQLGYVRKALGYPGVVG